MELKRNPGTHTGGLGGHVYAQACARGGGREGSTAHGKLHMTTQACAESPSSLLLQDSQRDCRWLAAKPASSFPVPWLPPPGTQRSLPEPHPTTLHSTHSSSMVDPHLPDDTWSKHLTTAPPTTPTLLQHPIMYHPTPTRGGEPSPTTCGDRRNPSPSTSPSPLPHAAPTPHTGS